MSTHAVIARENADGTVDSIYCHFDGYLSHTGRVLLEHYQDPNKIDALIALGNLSFLGEICDLSPLSPAVIYPIGKYRKPTIAYGRDRGEDDQEAITYPNLELFLNNRQSATYFYVRKAGFWWFGIQKSPLQILTPETRDPFEED